MKATAGEVMYETLKRYGVTHIFGLDEPLPLYESLDKEVIKPITIRDEKHGAIMAHGYAKATNKPGVCTAVRGPGATNLITGLAESFKSSIPVIAIVQDTITKYRGKNANLEFELDPLMKTTTKWVGRIDHPNRAAEMTRKAFRIATSGRPGPVALLCPDDILTAESEEKVYADPGCDRYPSMRVRASRESLEAAAELLTGARRPVLIAGGGSVISQAGNEVVRLAEKYGLPVATTLSGKGAIPEGHPLSIGVMGGYTGGKYGRGKIANEFVADADVVFLLGSRTDQTPYFNWTLPKEGTKIIHLDIDPLEIGRNFKTDVAMVGDVRETLIDFIGYCTEKSITMEIETSVEQIERSKDEWSKINQPFLVSEDAPVRPERLLRELADYVDPDTLVVTDASYASLWVMSHMDNMTTGTNFISPRAMAGIGWGLPAAIGAKMGHSGKKVFCVTGDGAFGYVMNELETAARYETKVITIVLNNRMYGFQKHYEELELGKSVECDLLDVDYSEVARALRCQGERVTDPKEINGALERALNASAPYVLDVVIDANAIPPIAMFDSFNVGPSWGAGPVEGEH